MPSNEQGNLILACDIGATFTRLALFCNGEMLRHEKYSTAQYNLLKGLSSRITNFIKEGEIIEVLAISVAGPVENGTATFTNLPGHPSLSEADFPDFKAVVILNDAAAATWAEYAKDSRNLVFITISSGIGAGVVMDGELLNFTKIAELGHRVIKSEYNFDCGCGDKNHWESFCSGKNLVRFYTEWANRNCYKSENFKESKEIFSAAKNGSETAKRFLDEGFGEVNRKAIKMIMEEFKPEKIIFGGSVAFNNQEEIRSELEGRVPGLPVIAFTEFGDEISLFGVAEYTSKTAGDLV